MNSQSPTVLISGGSIAGPALAWALRRAGFAPTLLERAPSMRVAGQNLDIRTTGRAVIEQMGLTEAVLKQNTGERGTRFLDHTGRSYAEFPVEAGRDGSTAEMEILRGDLSRLLLDLTENEIPHRYGDHVTAVEQSPEGVEVTLASGGTERYDLMVIAEGRRSRTRTLVFGDDVVWRDLGEYVAYGTIDRTDDDDDWWHWMTSTNSRMIALRPDNKGTSRANLAFFAPDLGLESIGFEAQMHVLRAHFADAGWKTARILDGFEAYPQEFYLERFARVTMPSWSRGRVVALGDAAWGSGPTGMGTSLALAGAYVLAGELGESYAGSGPAAAFAGYERVMRPWADKVQNFPPGIPRLMFPKSRAGLKVLKAVHRVAASPRVRHLAEQKLVSRPSPLPHLPDYPALRAE
ncbi:FAD-dependent monooxygenase [Kineosporia mesophila]|uniref:FAD-dependent monooxygenase n=1 Tax=Kineosporia mesophila TaxID=566012 RepID=A0ABP6ZB75_9ACTN|nr:FAD-dependent monooxygenase [Kineosporia mesophila]MCD5353021.1 FAD-dependent monooxygenase [Kineosporia mesophila]